MALADAYNESGEGRLAMREYIRAAELLPNDVTAQTKAAFVLAKANDFKQSRERALAALKLDPKNFDAQLLLANALVGLKQPEDAMKELEETIQMAPDDPRAYLEHGQRPGVAGKQGRGRSGLQAGDRPQPEGGHAATGARILLLVRQAHQGGRSGAEGSEHGRAGQSGCHADPGALLLDAEACSGRRTVPAEAGRQERHRGDADIGRPLLGDRPRRQSAAALSEARRHEADAQCCGEPSGVVPVQPRARQPMRTPRSTPRSRMRQPTRSSSR